MRFVPSLTPPLTAVKEGLKLQALARVKPVKPVQASPSPPLKAQRHPPPEASGDHTGSPERRYDAHVHGERRTYCRRIEHLPILIELRSGIDRRRHQQRAGDLTEHIDEKV